MIKKVLTSLSLSLALSSSLFAADVISEDNNITYEHALKVFQTKEYQKAYNEFNSLFYDNLSNQNLNFYLGRSAFELHDYQMALSAYERLLIQSPNNVRVQLEMARTYFMMKMYANAETEFRAILEDKNLPKQVRNKVTYYLVLIEQTKKRSFFNASVSFGIGYDTNANTTPLGDRIDIGPIVVPNTDVIADTYHQTIASLNHVYDFGEKGGFLFKHSLLALEKTLTTEYERNVVFLSYVPTISYRSGKLSYDLSVGVDYLFYGSEAFVGSTFWMPKITYLAPGGFRAALHFKQRFNSYADSLTKNRNSVVNEVGFNLDKAVTDSTLLTGFFLFQKETAANTTGIGVDVNRNMYTGSLMAIQNLAPKWNLKLQGIWRATQYLDVNSVGYQRQEFYGSYLATLNYKLFKKTALDLQANYIDNTANQDPYRYQKQQYLVTITQSF